MNTSDFEKKFRKRAGTTNKGSDYEDLLTALLAVRLSENSEIKNFNLSSNNTEFGDFDDVVFEYECNGDLKYTYLVQMKHKNEKTITPPLLADSKGEFSIQKYFKSFEKFHNKLEGNFSCVIYTNSQCEIPKHCEFSLKEFSNLKLRVCKDLRPENFLNTSVNEFVYKFEVVDNGEEIEASFKEFIDHLFLYSNQKDVVHLRKLLLNEFTKSYFCKENIFLAYINYINNWSKWENKKNYLNKNTVMAKISELLLRPYLNYSSHCIADFDKQLFFKSCLRCDIAVTRFDLHFSVFCNTTEKTEESATKLKQEFQINSESEEDYAVILWHMMKNPLIIRLDENNKKTIYKAIRLFESKDCGRKFILISDFIDRDEFNNFKLLRNVNDLYSTCDEEDRNRIENTPVLIQGRQFILKDIIGTNISNILTIDDYFKPGNIQIGECREELPIPYIDQFVSKFVVSFQFVNNLDIQSLAVINCNGKFDSIKQNIKNAVVINVETFLQKHFNDENQFRYQRIVVAAENRCSRKQFRKICKRNKGRHCYLFYINNQLQLELIQTSRDIGKIKMFLERSTFQESQLFEDNKLINIISAKPGAGKTIMIKYLKNNIPSNYWIVNINFRDHISFYRSRHTVENIVLHFLDSQRKSMTYDILTLQIRQVYENHKKVVFLWDGLDELPETYVPQAIETIQTLSSVGYISWITTRDTLQHFLEESLKVFALSINEMDQKQQKNYIRKHLETNQNPEELDVIIKKIIDIIAMTRDVAFLGIPLRIYMLTDLFLKDPKRYREFLDSTVILPDIIYHFIQEKCKFSYKDKGKYNFDNDFIDRVLDGYTRYRLLQYEMLALRSLLPNKALKHLNINDNEFLCDIEQFKDDLGLVPKIDVHSKTAVFVHSIYGKYFVATWMAKNLDKVKNFKNFIFDASYRTIRIMFDLILSKRCPAHIAVLHKNIDGLQKHIKDIDLKDKAGRTLLHLICSWGEPHPLLEVAVKDNTYFLKVTNKANLSKIESTSSEYAKILLYLLKKSCVNLSEKDFLFSCDAIEYADCALSLLAIDILSEYTKNFSLENLENFRDVISVSYYCILFNYERTITRLNNIEYIVDRQNGNSLLHLAVMRGYNHFLEKLLSIPKYREKINETNHYKQIVQQPFLGINITFVSTQNPLHIASTTGNRNAVNILTENGAFINYQDAAGNTALHLAIISGHLSLIQFLINKGSNVNLPDKDNNTALHYIVQNGELPFIRKIVDRRACICKNNLNQSPLDIAAIQNRVDILDLLLTEALPGNNISIEKYMQIPFLYAVVRGQYKIVRCLLKYKVKVNDIVNHVTFLCVAAQYRQIKIVFLLLKHGADPNIRVYGGLNALSFAVISQHSEILRLLLRYNVKVADLDTNGNTCLIKAVMDENHEIATILLENGANVNHQNKQGASPMHFASVKGNIELIKLLLKYKADINVKNNKGGTPLHVAAFSRRKEVVEFLIRNGADCNIAAKGLAPLMFMKLPTEITLFASNVIVPGSSHSSKVPKLTVNIDIKFKHQN